ncbi:hypothetical protein T05_2178 [Trichinella murrelli]|uniref:Uncharacterized protein n=1 Tax=Trichinella murrelli TaxID=144512 RepID=A0A0V0T2E8_9BILA|nr:hypothetical protein T05_2178 [Trichinella murrelli]
MKKRRSENGDDTKQNKRRQRPWDSNSKSFKRGRHEAERGRHKVKQQNTGGAAVNRRSQFC